MDKLQFKVSSALKDLVGKDLIRNDNIAVFELVKNSYDAFATKVEITFEKNRIVINKKYGNIPPIKCYPNMLNQVFMNILVNAAQAIENVGTITIDTSFDNNKLFVKIKDTGCGIKEPDKIFLAGYTTKGVGAGTGLGLAISQKIVEKHDGKIEVFSKINEGSEFIITIPSK